MLNLKYAETPWYYLSVVKLNEYFAKLPIKKQKTIVISSLIPYYIDFYSNKTYDLLPLSLEQEFRNNRKEAWGNNDYSDLLALYKSYLDRGYDVYVHNYGLGNEKNYKMTMTLYILTLKQHLSPPAVLELVIYGG